jgi:hypothetical protein
MAIPASVYCGSLPIVQSVFPFPELISNRDSGGRDRAVGPSLLNFRRNLYWGELPLVMDSFRIDAFTTKIGLSSGAVTVCCFSIV